MKRVIYSAYKYSSDVIRKISLLEQMNEVMKSMNNENAYYTWIYTVPDEATREDFEDIAMDDEFFNECRALFDKLYKKVEGKLFSYSKIKDDIEIINLEIEKLEELDWDFI